MIERKRAAAALMVAVVGLVAAAGLMAARSGVGPATSQDVSIESIRGIEGIDTITLENLEAVLRMQSRPEENRAHGGGGSAAALVNMETAEKDDEKQPDTREEMSTEEGS